MHTKMIINKSDPSSIAPARTLKFNPQPMRDSLDSLRPDGLVEFGVESDVRCAHCLVSEIDHGFDSPRSTLFEGAAVYAFVEVDGVLPGNDILEGRASLAAGL